MRDVTIITYLLFIASVLLFIWSLKRRHPETKAHYAVIGFSVIVFGILTWSVVDDIVMNYVDANIGIGLIHFGVWIVTAFYFILAAFFAFLKRRLV